jgi:lysozyme
MTAFSPRSGAGLAALGLALACRPPSASEVEPGTHELQVCAKGPTVEGIDVSVYQASIDWAAVKRAGIAFAVTRISNGIDRRDTTFDANWAGIKAAGLVRGAYQYFQPGQDAAAQAALVVEKVGRLGAGDLPVQLDMEVTGGQPAATIISQMATWTERVTAGTAKQPLIYTGKFFWDDNIGKPLAGNYPLWVANYGVTCPNLPAVWTSWTIWQYTSTGSVAGVTGNVDRDRFNGTIDDLRRFTGAAAGSLPDAGAPAHPPDSRAAADAPAPRPDRSPTEDAPRERDPPDAEAPADGTISVTPRDESKPEDPPSSPPAACAFAPAASASPPALMLALLVALVAGLRRRRGLSSVSPHLPPKEPACDLFPSPRR